MKNRIGTDIVEVARVQDAITRTGEAFVQRIYTPSEQAYCDGRGAHRFECYAARFAAKEAFSKAVGTGIGASVSFDEIEILNDSLGKPAIQLSGKTAVYFEEHFTGAEIDVSLSHTAQLAIATVLIGE